MGLSFSQRIGAEQVPDSLISESACNSLRNRIWNILYLTLFETYEKDDYISSQINELIKHLWVHCLNWQIDEMDYRYANVREIKQYFFSCNWHEFFSFLEGVFKLKSSYISENLVATVNRALESEFSSYRIVEGMVTEIHSKEERDEISKAIKETAYGSVKDHLLQSLKHLSDRNNPDFRNSIKESISAVESLCSIIARDDKATLGQALKIVQEKHTLHPALKDAFSKLYGYTSNSDGIRHKLLEESDRNLTQADARFMLIACSAFVNYLIDITKN